MPELWGRWYTEEEAQQVAKEMNELGRNIEKKTVGIREWVEEVERLRQAHGKVF